MSPLAVTVGLLVALSDIISRVVGHRGKLLPRFPNKDRARIEQGKSAQKRKVILISGSTPVAMALARDFAKLGHRVIISDQEAVSRVNRARYSRGVSDFVPYEKYERSRFGSRLREGAAYPEKVLRLTILLKADIWIPCEDWSSDENKMQAAGVIRLHRPECEVLFPGPDALNLSWDPASLSKFVTSLDSIIKTPSYNIVHSRGQIHSMLGSKDSKRSLLLTGPLPQDSFSDEVGFVKGHQWRDSGYSEYSFTTASASEDYLVESRPSSRASLADLQIYRHDEPQKSFKLPLDSLDKTYDLLASVPINSSSLWSASEVLVGKPCVVHALVEANTIRAFMALMHPTSAQYPASLGDPSPFEQSSIRPLSPLDSSSSLFVAFKQFTELFVARLPSHAAASLTLHFILTSKPADFGVELRPWIVDCKFAIPTSFLTVPAASTTWASSIIRLGNKASAKRTTAVPLIRTNRATGVYSFPATIIQQCIATTWLFLTLRMPFTDLMRSWRHFIDKVLYWHEELWDFRDPAPFIWFWTVEKPILTAMDFIWRLLQVLRLSSVEV